MSLANQKTKDPQVLLQNHLIQSLADLKIKNPSYSLRSFAKKLKVSPAALSEILNGKRIVSNKLAERILGNLNADPETTTTILGQFLIRTGPARAGASVARPVTQLTNDQFKTISDWYHFAILCLLEMVHFDPTIESIAARLNLPKTTINQAVQRLEALKMLSRDSDGKLHLTGEQFHTSDGPFSSAIRLSHAQSYELARQCLEQEPPERVDFTSLTMAIDPKKLGRAREMIRKFRTEIARELEVDPKSEVYMLTVGLFPLSQCSPDHQLESK
jgi:transcriptional regulator with XRE-family HTH domain